VVDQVGQRASRDVSRTTTMFSARSSGPGPPAIPRATDANVVDVTTRSSTSCGVAMARPPCGVPAAVAASVTT
jgi:hypothetical protein